MEIYLTETGKGKTMYIPNYSPNGISGVDLIAPDCYEEDHGGASCDEGGRKRLLTFRDEFSFFPALDDVSGDIFREDAIKAIHYRIENPDDNKKFVSAGYNWLPHEARQLLVKTKTMNVCEQKSLDSLVNEMLLLRKSPGFPRYDSMTIPHSSSAYRSFSSSSFRSLKDAKRKFEIMVRMVDCLMQYDQIYNSFFRSAKWIGTSRKVYLELRKR